MTVETLIRSFVDLRAFAATAAPSPAGPGNDPFAHASLLDLPAGPITIGLVRLAPDAVAAARIAGDAFLIVLDGAVEIEQGGQRHAVEHDRSIVIPRGNEFGWRTKSPTTLIMMIYDGPVAATPQIVPIDESALLEPSGAPLAELLVGPTPQCRNHTDYRSDDGTFVCGTWDSTPYHRRSMPYGHYELMHLLEGEVTFVDEAERSGTFRKGDIFLVEQGAHCSWKSEVPVKKVYAIYRPAP